MSDLGSRRELPPPDASAVEVSHWQVARAAVGIIVDRIRSKISGGVLETIRARFFRERTGADALYGDARSEVLTFVVSCRRIFWALAIFSGLSNLLMLNGSFFMLQVYDRVLPAGASRLSWRCWPS